VINDTLNSLSYSDLMAENPAHLVLTLRTKEPIEVGDFVAAFTSISGQYEEFVRNNYPDLKSDSAMFVREVRAGSIEAELIPLITTAASIAILMMDQALIIKQFLELYKDKISAYLHGGKVETATKSDLKDFMDGVVAIANDPDASASIDLAYYEDKQKKIKAGLRFKTREARTAIKAIEEHKRILEAETSADYRRVLMVFSQSNTKDTALNKRSGERVVIEDITTGDRPLIYASELAERRIKHEIREADDNVFKKGFIVDVNVQSLGGRPVGYRVTHVHQVIDLEV
jgi:hypothetical protein